MSWSSILQYYEKKNLESLQVSLNSIKKNKNSRVILLVEFLLTEIRRHENNINVGQPLPSPPTKLNDFVCDTNIGQGDLNEFVSFN